MYLTVQDYLKECPVKPDYQDDDWYFIMFEFAMNYSLDSIRIAYAKQHEEEKKKVNAEKLRALGYSEEQIRKAKF